MAFHSFGLRCIEPLRGKSFYRRLRFAVTAKASGGVLIATMMAHWFTEHEHGGFPVEKAALGSCDLSVLHVGGNWEWLVRQAGRDVAEGTARGLVDAKQEAEGVALRLG